MLPLFKKSFPTVPGYATNFESHLHIYTSLFYISIFVYLVVRLNVHSCCGVKHVIFSYNNNNNNNDNNNNNCDNSDDTAATTITEAKMMICDSDNDTYDKDNNNNNNNNNDNNKFYCTKW